MNENIKNLIEIIKQNPTLPIVPMVNSEIIDKDSANGYWLSSIGDCFVDDIAITVLDNTSRIFFKRDIDDVLKNGDKNKLDKMVQLAVDNIDKINWTKVIVVLIEQ